MRYHVIADYAAQYAEPISFERGETIQVERQDDAYPGWWWCTDKRGRSGWVHQSYFEEDDYRHVALEDYDARELSVRAGDLLDGLSERGGWALCLSAAGEQGWVPLANLQVDAP